MLKSAVVLGMLAWINVMTSCSQDVDVAGDGLRQVGRPCIPADELLPEFSGFASGETNIGQLSGSDRTVCLANGFQGRVSCPYGQTAAEMATLPSDSPRRCRVPDGAGNITAVPVEVPVEPQLMDRRAEIAAHYSCRCDGPSGGDYCSCPITMACVPLIEGGGEFGGSYCVKRGYDPQAPLGATCDADSADRATNCGNDRANP
ncbi:MAG TPA: hypothetical protein VER33_19995 [Polyangiaceae bacterium]|nr:hypothetical protein [Polyangiaceae bacterium]